MTELLIERTRAGRIKWNDQIDTFIRTCLSRNMSRNDIALLLGVTRNTIVGRVYRMQRSKPYEAH
jgi:hypothetical protein